MIFAFLDLLGGESAESVTKSAPAAKVEQLPKHIVLQVTQNKGSPVKPLFPAAAEGLVQAYHAADGVVVVGNLEQTGGQQ